MKSQVYCISSYFNVESIVSYDVESGEGRIAKTLERVVAYYGEEKCGGNPIYELHSSFSLVFDNKNGSSFLKWRFIYRY